MAGNNKEQQVKKGVLKAIYFCTVITFCSLYAAQPIQPTFQQEFNLSSLQAILFTTLMMAPLGFAPLVYGILLESFSAKRLVRYAILILGVLELVFCFADSYLLLLTIRGLQGMVIPAILTSLVSYISFTSTGETVQAAVARYIAATIMGGFLGRFLSGLFTDLFGWRFFFFVLGVLLIYGFYLLRNLEQDANLQYSKPSFHEAIGVLRKPHYFWLYMAIFAVFFVFAGALNFLPFALKSINPDFNETGIGIMYSGYVMGILVSLNVRRIIEYFGGEIKAVWVGVLLYGVGTAGFMFTSFEAMFVAMFVFCTGMFTAHSILSGFVNTLSHGKKGIANGLYISFYYLGGTIGSFAPGIIYGCCGWRAFLAALMLVLGWCLFCVFKLKQSVALHIVPEKLSGQLTGQPPINK